MGKGNLLVNLQITVGIQNTSPQDVRAPLTYGLFWAEDNWDPMGSREKTAPPLTTYKNLNWRFSWKKSYY